MALVPDHHNHAALMNRKRPSRTRKTEKEEWTTCTKCSFGFWVLLCQILLFGSLGLTLFWILHYREGFAWHEAPEKEFNLHPVLMIGGFVFFVGEAMLVYRTCRCCRHIYNKLWHTILHLLAMPAIAIGVVAAFDSHNLKRPIPIPNLYSLHSWMGLGTLGLFGLQFVVGFFSFLVLLCCDKSTARFRAALHPIHVHFGLATFLMAIATCVTGLTEKVIYTYNGQGSNKHYKDLPEEALVVNVLAMVLIATGLVMAFVIRCQRYQRVSVVTINERL